MDLDLTAHGAMCYWLFMKFRGVWVGVFFAFGLSHGTAKPSIYLTRKLDCDGSGRTYVCVPEDNNEIFYSLSVSNEIFPKNFGLTCQIGSSDTPEQASEVYHAMDRLFSLPYLAVDKSGWHGEALFEIRSSAHLNSEGLFSLSCSAQSESKKSLKSQIKKKEWQNLVLGFGLGALAPMAKHSSACRCNPMLGGPRFTQCILASQDGEKQIYINGSAHLMGSELKYLRFLQEEFIRLSNAETKEDRELLATHQTILQALLYGPESSGANKHEISQIIEGLKAEAGQGSLLPYDYKQHVMNLLIHHLETGYLAQQLMQYHEDLAFIQAQLLSSSRPVTVFAVEYPANYVAKKIWEGAAHFSSDLKLLRTTQMSKQQIQDSMLLLHDKIFYLFYRHRAFGAQAILGAESSEAHQRFLDAVLIGEMLRVQARWALQEPQAQSNFDKLFENYSGCRLAYHNNPNLAIERLKNTLNEMFPDDEQKIIVSELSSAIKEIWLSCSHRDHAMALALYHQKEPTLLTVGSNHVLGVTQYLLDFCRANAITPIRGF